MKLDRFINRPVLSTVISVLIVILGLIGLATLPITQYPDIAPPTVSVRATYTGANAQTVLNSVITPLIWSSSGAWKSFCIFYTVCSSFKGIEGSS